MTWSEAFQLANLFAATGWAVLILGPRRFAWLAQIPATAIPALLGAAYLVLVSLFFAATEGGYSSLEDVRTLLSSDAILLAGWIHYLAFDLFVGAWIARQCDRAGTSRWIQAPILLATFQFGPAGLVLYFALRAGARLTRPQPLEA